MKKICKITKNITLTALLFSLLFSVTAFANGRPPEAFETNPAEEACDYVCFTVEDYGVEKDSPEDEALDYMIYNWETSFFINITDSKGNSYTQNFSPIYHKDDNSHYFVAPDYFNDISAGTYTITGLWAYNPDNPGVDFWTCNPDNSTNVDLDKYVKNTTFVIPDNNTETTYIYIDFDVIQFIFDNAFNNGDIMTDRQNGSKFFDWVYGDDGTPDRVPEEPTTEEPTTEKETESRPSSIVIIPHETEEDTENETEPSVEATTEADTDNDEDDDDKKDLKGGCQDWLKNNLFTIILLVVVLIVCMVFAIKKKSKTGA